MNFDGYPTTPSQKNEKTDLKWESRQPEAQAAQDNTFPHEVTIGQMEPGRMKSFVDPEYEDILNVDIS